MFRIVLPVLTALVLSACASTGVQVSEAAATQFKEGVSTEQDIVSKLGPPTQTTTSGGRKTLVYAGAQSQAKAATFIPIVGAFAGGADVKSSSAVYIIGPNGVLERMAYSQYGSGSRSGTTVTNMPSQEPRAEN